MTVLSMPSNGIEGTRMCRTASVGRRSNPTRNRGARPYRSGRWPEPTTWCSVEHRRFRRGSEPTDVLGRPSTVGIKGSHDGPNRGRGRKVLERPLAALGGPLGESRPMRKALGVLAVAVVLPGACSDGRKAGPEAQPPSTSGPERHRDQLLVGATETPCPPGSPPQHLCQVKAEGNHAVGIGTPSGMVGSLVLPTNATLYSCPEYYAIDVACYLDPDGRWVVATTSSGGGVTSTSLPVPSSPMSAAGPDPYVTT